MWRGSGWSFCYMFSPSARAAQVLKSLVARAWNMSCNYPLAAYARRGIRGQRRGLNVPRIFYGVQTA